MRAWPEPGGLAVYFLDVTDRIRAEEAARRATARTTLLGSVTAELSGALDGELSARPAGPAGRAHSRRRLHRDRGRPRRTGEGRRLRHTDPQRRALLDRYTEIRLDTLPLASPVGLALHAGTAVTESVTAVLDLMPPGPARGMLQALGPESAVVVPLPAEERTVGVLTLYQDPGRDVADDDLETLQQVAVQAGRAIERVHRHNQQAQLAEALQRSLLTDPPEIEDAHHRRPLRAGRRGRPGGRRLVRRVPAAGRWPRWW